MRIWLFILLIFLGIHSPVFAQNPEDEFVQKYDITFPIVELGNCNNIQTCKVYCDQPENHESCIAFAKSKGLYQETVGEKQVTALSPAKNELGCNAVDSCKSFCQQKVNQERCQAFAQKHGLATPPTSKDEELLSKAKQNLSCDSLESCKTLCDKQENYTKCAALLQDQVTQDDRDMFEKYKPLIKQHLGCDSLVTCMAFCINPLNTKKCEDFGKVIEEQQGGTSSYDSSGPPEVWCPKVSPECSWDGTNCVCQGPQTCIQSNNNAGCTWDGTQCNCPGIEGSPQEWCPKAGPGCAWDGTNCVCPGGSETPIGPGPLEPGDVWCPKLGQYCVWDGSSCTCWDECVKAGGIWDGKTCQPPPPTAEDQKAWCSKQGQYCVWDGLSCTCWDDCVKAGGTWTGSKCEPPQGTNTTESPEASCVKNPDCKWTGEICYCTPVQAPQTQTSPSPTVQGVSTNRSLLQQIWDLVLRLL